MFRVRKQCVFNPTGNISIVCIDCGLKNNQLRILCQLGAKVTVFPWNHPVKQDGFDGLFLSSGPGDPQTQCRETITIIKSGITSETIKPPCLLEGTQYCFIASQNHAFAVLTSHVDKDWSVLFTNQNDLSNEGLIHDSKPFFSVQFYPEHFAGLRDAKNLFQIFLDIVQSYKLAKPINAEKYLVEQLSKRVNGANAPPPPPAFCSRLKKVLILGSNGLKFGQPGEFDCSANQAVKAMNEDNISTVLLNPSTAITEFPTDLSQEIQFDQWIRSFSASVPMDSVAFRSTPLNSDDFLTNGFRTPIQSIKISTNRCLFTQKMLEIGEKTIPYKVVKSFEEALIAAERFRYPVLARASFPEGDRISGFVKNREELVSLVTSISADLSQLLIDKSVKG
ncbi:unnamed protein product [Rotaria magnacalcarata]|uniref:Uncharacterized protein n=3 Tax=Rotaria magnacalcarata TaxID=392030 RepID=A0A816WAU2_9BILA|nr:unnamed protein product [Rotaria magnacalcarata]